jgi:hypothetical protein
MIQTIEPVHEIKDSELTFGIGDNDSSNNSNLKKEEPKNIKDRIKSVNKKLKEDCFA